MCTEILLRYTAAKILSREFFIRLRTGGRGERGSRLNQGKVEARMTFQHSSATFVLAAFLVLAELK